MGNGDGSVGKIGVLVTDALDKEQDQHVVLVSAGIPAAATLIAERSDLAIKFGFLPGHRL